jgi:hypothetical protein
MSLLKGKELGSIPNVIPARKRTPEVTDIALPNNHVRLRRNWTMNPPQCGIVSMLHISDEFTEKRQIISFDGRIPMNRKITSLND